MPPFSLLSTLLQALESLAVLMALTRWPCRMDNYVNLVQCSGSSTKDFLMKGE